MNEKVVLAHFTHQSIHLVRSFKMVKIDANGLSKQESFKYLKCYHFSRLEMATLTTIILILYYAQSHLFGNSILGYFNYSYFGKWSKCLFFPL